MCVNKSENCLVCVSYRLLFSYQYYEVWITARISFTDNVRISRVQFETPRNNVHIVDLNADDDKTDRLWKVAYNFSFRKTKCCEELELDENLSMYQSIIPYKDETKPINGENVYALWCFWNYISFCCNQSSTTLPAELLEKSSATTDRSFGHQTEFYINVLTNYIVTIISHDFSYCENLGSKVSSPQEPYRILGLLKTEREFMSRQL